MSGKPSTVGVSNFRSAWERLGKAAEQCEVLRIEIANQSKSLREWSSAYERAKEDVFKLMEAMDIRSEGNAGYEQRILWFLAEFWGQMQPTRPSSSINGLPLEDIREALG